MAVAEDFEVGMYSVFSRPNLDIASQSLIPGHIEFNPNSGPQLGWSGKYKSFQIQGSPSLFGSTQYKEEYGPTSFFDFRLASYHHKWGGDFYHQYFRGFYSDASFISGRNDRRNLKLTSSIFNAYLPLTQGSSVDRLETGIDENGAKLNFLLMGGASHQRLRTDSTLITRSPNAEASHLYLLRDLKIWETNLGLGAGVSTYFYGMFFDYHLMLAAGPQYRSANIPISSFKPSLKIHMQANWGYEWNDLSVGIKELFDMNAFKQGDETIIFTAVQTRVFGTYAF